MSRMCVTLDVHKGGPNDCVRCGENAAGKLGKPYSAWERICKKCLALPWRQFARLDPKPRKRKRK